jgi:hypothetical protein
MTVSEFGNGFITPRENQKLNKMPRRMRGSNRAGITENYIARNLIVCTLQCKGELEVE